MKLNRAYVNRQAILERDDYTCQYCGHSLFHDGPIFGFGPATIVVDHIIPVTAGGTSTKDNLVAACSPCNKILYNKVFDSFEQRRAYVVGLR